ncbi:MAG TPA: hypothetical protein DCE23_00945 [Firmicutes bacterium]|nr:hypothetical protein [Bacillota bacterium]
MSKINTILKYFFKKNLKDLISFSIILFIATILFSSTFIINKNIGKDYDKLHKELNTSDAFFTIPSNEYSDSLLQDIKKINNIKEVEIQNGIMLSIPVKVDGSNQEQTQIFYNIEVINKINKRNVILEKHKDSSKGIFLSNYTYIHSDLKLGDKYEFKINGITYSFPVIGIIEEMQYGNYSSSVIGEYLDNSSYNKLLENNKSQEVTTISIKSSSSKESYNDISKYLASKNINILNKNEHNNIKNSRLITTNVIILILIVFSCIILIISLFVSKFKISETLEEEIANMGVLNALGYTSNEIIISCILPYIICGLTCSIIGISLSYPLLPIFSNIIEMQSGFIWNSKIDIIANLFVLIINISLIILFTLTASLKLKKLNPINAIRGLAEKEQGKNYFEIEKTKGNIHFILTLKNFINTQKQNILLGIVLFFITIISSFLGILFYNVNMNPINFINTLVEEHPSVIVISDKDLRDYLSKESNVKNVLYYDESGSVNYQGNSYKTFISENYNNLSNDLCYEGNNPQNESEVAIGNKIANDNNINIGDYITISKNSTNKQYKVVGFIQSVNYFGELIEMTLDGYKELDKEYLPKSIYIYLEDEDKVDEFITNIKAKYNSDITSIVNYVESLNSAMEMFIPLISIICIIIIIITLLLIYLILYILLTGIITKKKQELGIFKALGYENKELVIQLVGGFIPSTIISTILGLIISKLFISSIYTMIFKAVGAYKVSFEYPIFIFIIIVLFIIISTVIIGTLLAKKIKKISAYSLIKD